VLSHLTPFDLLKTHSKENGDLELKLVRGSFQLSTSSAVYSFGRKYHAFNTAFEKLKPKLQSVQSVLVLGGGLGSVCEILQKDFHLSAQYTLVEFDPIICSLAEQVLESQIKKNCKIVYSEARDYLSACSTQFDLVVVDLFNDIQVPDVFRSESFLEDLKPLLSSKGHLLFNLVTSTDQTKRLAEQFYQQTFRKTLANSASIPGNGNLILYAPSGV